MASSSSSKSMEEPGIYATLQVRDKKPKSPSEGAEVMRDYVRPLEKKDLKVVKMLVGQGAMEGLARANNRVYTHPLSLLLWVLASLALDYVLNFRPNPKIPMTYLNPLIGFGITALPGMGVVEYIHRPQFTRLMRERVGAKDMIAPEQYYSEPSTPASRTDSEGPKAVSGGRSKIWVFVHDDEVVGAIALDGKSGGRSLSTVLGAEEKEIKANTNINQVEATPAASSSSSSSSPAAQSFSRGGGLRKRPKVIESLEQEIWNGISQIRHLDVDLPYRRKKVGTELLSTALDHAFIIGGGGGKAANRVIALSNPMMKGGEKVLAKCGFKPLDLAEEKSLGLDPAKGVGIGGWTGRWWGVTRGKWVRAREVIYKGKE